VKKPEEAAETVPEWQGSLVHIYISPGHDYWGRKGEGRLQNGIRDVAEVECIAGKGLAGDRYFGYRAGYKGQVTFFEAGVVEEIREKFQLPKLPASVFRRNLVIEGVQLRRWIGKRFQFQGVTFEGSQECKPCDWMNRVVAPGTEDFMRSHFRGGLRAKILTSGILRRS
jgi:MOSC domain-containing protein YiiM